METKMGRGRPKRFDTPRKFAVLLEEPMRELLGKLARERHWTKIETVRQALRLLDAQRGD